MTDTDWESVGELVRLGMRRLAMGQADLVRASGLSDATIRALQQGKPGNYREQTLARVDAALQWEPGTLARVRDGTPLQEVIAELEPSRATESRSSYVTAALHREVEELTLQQQEILLGVAKELRAARRKRG